MQNKTTDRFPFRVPSEGHDDKKYPNEKENENAKA
jgi:hypothetical protein